MKYIPTNPKRSIRDISSLYISGSPPGASPLAEPEPAAAHGSDDARRPGASETDPAPILTLALVSDSDPFAVGLSFCRWLSLAFDAVTMIAEPPSSSWMRRLHRQTGTSRYLWGDSGGCAEAADGMSGLQIVLASGCGAPDLGRDEDILRECATREWPSVAERLSGPSSAVVRTLRVESWSEPGLAAAKTDLWACVLPPRVDAFIDFYRFIRAQREAGAKSKFYAFLDRPSDPEGYRRIEETWSELTTRFLGSPIALLGEIDGRLASGVEGEDGEDGEDGRWLRMCEENLGPPWPSDLQATLSAERDENLRIVRDRSGEIHGTRLYDKVQAAGGSL